MFPSLESLYPTLSAHSHPSGTHELDTSLSVLVEVPNPPDILTPCQLRIVTVQHSDNQSPLCAGPLFS